MFNSPVEYNLQSRSLLKSATKQCFSVDCVRNIAPTLREAFRVSQVQRPGPVFVELPLDILYPYNIVAEQFNSMSRKPQQVGIALVESKKQSLITSLKARLIGAYSNYCLSHIFADAWKEREYDPLPIHVQQPKPTQVDAVVQALLKARRPMCIIGSQAMLGPHKSTNLAEDVKKIGLPTYLNGSARGLLGPDYSLQFRHARKEAIREADCVLLLGAICDFRLSYGKIFKPSTKVISINRCGKAARLNAGVFWNPSITVEADVASFINILATRLSKAFPINCSSTNGPRRGISMQCKVDQEWVKKLRQRDDEKDKSIESMAKERTEEYINPLKLLLKLQEVYKGRDSIIVADGGDFVASASYIMKPYGPRRWLDPGPFGTLGCGAGFALAAKLLNPEKEVVAVMGDGAFGYAIPELDTFVRHNLPVLWLIGNDACWTQIAREQVPMLGSSIGCELAHTDYDRVAVGFGANGTKLVNDDDVDKLDAIEKARSDLADSNKTTIINALIGKTKFRQGSISV